MQAQPVQGVAVVCVIEVAGQNSERVQYNPWHELQDVLSPAHERISTVLVLFANFDALPSSRRDIKLEEDQEKPADDDQQTPQL